MKRYILLSLFFLILVWPVIALAHRVNIFAYIEDHQIKGEVYFSDGTPAKNAKVQILPISGSKILAQTLTDKKGQFNIKLPTNLKEKALRIIALAEMGHRAEIKLVSSQQQKIDRSKEIPNSSVSVSTLSQREIISLIDQELEKKLQPIRSLLKEIIQRLEKPSFCQIIGGIGYIFGIFGIIAWVSSRKK